MCMFENMALKLVAWVGTIRDEFKLSVDTATDEMVKFIGFKFWLDTEAGVMRTKPLSSLTGGEVDQLAHFFLGTSFGVYLGLGEGGFRLPVPAMARLVAEFSDFDFSRLETVERGRLLDRFIECAFKGNLAQLRVPVSIARFLVGCLSPRSGEAVFDPSFGIGDLLVGASRHAGTLLVGGLESSRLAARLMKLRLAVERFPLMAEDVGVGGVPKNEIDWRGKFDLALSFPAFGRRIGQSEPIPECPSSIADLSEIQAFVRCAHSLKPGGRMAIVIPDVVLESVAFDEFRKTISKDVELVLSYAFDYRVTSFSVPRSPVSVLVLRKRSSTNMPLGEVLLSAETPPDVAVSSFADFRMSRKLW